MAFSNKHRPAALAMAAVLGATVMAAPLREARADDVSPTGKGIVGGALLGAEVPVIIEGIAGVHSGLGLRHQRHRGRGRRRGRRLRGRAELHRRQGADVHARRRPRARHPGRGPHPERDALPARRGRHGGPHARPRGRARRARGEQHHTGSRRGAAPAAASRHPPLAAARAAASPAVPARPCTRALSGSGVPGRRRAARVLGHRGPLPTGCGTIPTAFHLPVLRVAF